MFLSLSTGLKFILMIFNTDFQKQQERESLCTNLICPSGSHRIILNNLTSPIFNWCQNRLHMFKSCSNIYLYRGVYLLQWEESMVILLLPEMNLFLEMCTLYGLVAHTESKSPLCILGIAFPNFPSIPTNQCQNDTMIFSLEACKQETETKEQMLKLSDECQIH